MSADMPAYTYHRLRRWGKFMNDYSGLGFPSSSCTEWGKQGAGLQTRGKGGKPDIVIPEDVQETDTAVSALQHYSDRRYRAIRHHFLDDLNYKEMCEQHKHTYRYQTRAKMAVLEAVNWLDGKLHA